MRCDPINWKQSLFTASDMVNLFLHRPEGGVKGASLHSHFRTVQPAHVQYILGAEAIDLLVFLPPHKHAPTLFNSHLFLSALPSKACLSALTASMTM